MIEKLTNKYIKLYMELAKVNKNESVSAHIALDEHVSVYLDGNIVMAYLADREYEHMYFSFEIYTKEFTNDEIEDMDEVIATNIMNRIIKEMEFTLELWRDANEN